MEKYSILPAPDPYNIYNTVFLLTGQTQKCENTTENRINETVYCSLTCKFYA